MNYLRFQNRELVIGYIMLWKIKEKEGQLTRNEKLILIKWAKDKPINLSSAKKYKENLILYKDLKKETNFQKKFPFQQ